MSKEFVVSIIVGLVVVVSIATALQALITRKLMASAPNMGDDCYKYRSCPGSDDEAGMDACLFHGVCFAVLNGERAQPEGTEYVQMKAAAEDLGYTEFEAED